MMPLTVVGIGDDGPRGLGDAAREAIARAEVLYGGARHLAFFAEHPARRVDLGAGFAAAMRELETPSEACRVVLASGDPMLFGIGATLAARIGPAAFEVLPHPSSVHLACARLGVPERDLAVLSAHGRDLAPVLARAMTHARMAILLDDDHDARAVARALLDAGMEDAEAAVCSHLGGVEERIVRGTLSTIAAGTAHASLSLLVVLRQPAEPARHRRAGIPDEEFAHRAGMITKAEVRALSVAALQLQPAHTVWDIGAGSGSVAVEAAMLVPDGRVLAIERDEAQRAHIATNRVRFRVPAVEVVAGDAPAALDGLPAPDAVFIGGGGADLPAIIEAARAALRPGGRLVVNLVALERLGPAIDQLRDWAVEVTQVSIARGVPVGDATRLDALNPVCILTATKPADA
jgi:precorrin-6Y C5,15-methyltransferase (decarboxylating)